MTDDANQSVKEIKQDQLFGKQIQRTPGKAVAVAVAGAEREAVSMWRTLEAIA